LLFGFLFSGKKAAAKYPSDAKTKGIYLDHVAFEFFKYFENQLDNIKVNTGIRCLKIKAYMRNLISKSFSTNIKRIKIKWPVILQNSSSLFYFSLLYTFDLKVGVSFENSWKCKILISILLLLEFDKILSWNFVFHLLVFFYNCQALIHLIYLCII